MANTSPQKHMKPSDEVKEKLAEVIESREKVRKLMAEIREVIREPDTNRYSPYKRERY